MSDRPDSQLGGFRESRRRATSAAQLCGSTSLGGSFTRSGAPLRRLGYPDGVSTSREVTHRYSDPLEVIWVSLARRLGMEIVRGSDVYASWDGRGTLTIAPQRDLDPDDCLAQMVLHEVCHALVAGPLGWGRPDWGLDDSDLVGEHATNRLQAALAGRYGLRRMLATTTDFRTFYDSLPPDPLSGEGADVDLAREADQRARCGPWAARLRDALRATHALARHVVSHTEPTSLWSRFDPLHASGLPMAPRAPRSENQSCVTCAWFASNDGDGSRGTCRQARYASVEGEAEVSGRMDACVLWEPSLSPESCGACGACCRGGFDWVELEANDPACQRHPDLVSKEGDVLLIRRPDGRCRALVGDGGATSSGSGPYRCRIYAERPRPCAEFELAGDACLEGRRRVGLSR